MKPPTKAKQAPKKSLTVRQERFCELIVEGKDGTAAYLGAGWTCSREAAKVSASRLLTLDNIKAKIAELRKPQTAESLMTKEEKLSFLTSVIRTPVGAIGPDSLLCQEYSEETIGGGERGKLKRGKAASGNETSEPTRTRLRVKMMDKLRALELHSKLVGDFEPEKVAFEPGKQLADIMARAANAVAVLSRIGRKTTVQTTTRSGLSRVPRDITGDAS